MGARAARLRGGGRGEGRRSPHSSVGFGVGGRDRGGGRAPVLLADYARHQVTRCPSIRPDSFTSNILIAIGTAQSNRGTVSFSPAHDDDFHLAQECLEGKLSALEHLQDTLREPLRAFLQSCGGKPDEVGEIVTDLWGDCVTPRNGKRPKLAHYDGTCALKSFLSGVTLKVLLTRRRKEKRRSELVPTVPGADGEEAPDSGSAPNDTSEEESLLHLMRSAVETAFMSCSAEEFVLLKLRYLAGVHPPELAKMFGCSRSTIDRQTEDAQREIETAALRSIKASDPWLELRWPDFVELCRHASPACFAME